MLPSSLSEEEYSAVKHKAGYWSFNWSLGLSDVMAALGCGLSKATRIRAQALARLKQEYPSGPPTGSRVPKAEPVTIPSTSEDPTRVVDILMSGHDPTE